MNFCRIVLLSAALVSAGTIDEWDQFEKQVRDQTINKDSARTIFPALFRSLCGYSGKDTFTARMPWLFPVEGYGMHDVGKGGFKPGIYYGGSGIKGYDFFDGNRHGGHPAYDIFIRDTNRDSRDDRAGKPVNVIAPADMLVLSVNASWEAGSAIRGGRYVWALVPDSGLLLYFAHLDSITAAPGAIARAGEKIGTVGRSGKNAAAATSPTHLHLMVLKVEQGKIKPLDFLQLFSRPKAGR
jgi:hypothetical protein